MKGPQQREFDICFDGHVVLNRVQRSQDQVKDADSIPQFWWESLYDYSKAAAHLEMLRSLQTGSRTAWHHRVDGRTSKYVSFACIGNERMDSMPLGRLHLLETRLSML